MSNKDLLDLYKIVVEEEHFFLNEHQKRVAFYTSLLVTLTSGMITGYFFSEKIIHFWLLLLGAITVISISFLARFGTERMYQRFLESITVRAKLEHRLEVKTSTSQEQGENASWVTNEPLVTKRHIDSRHNLKYKTSEDWVKGHLKKITNYHGITVVLFDIGIILGGMFLIFSICLIKTS